jgi:hypothetical protein
MCGGLEDIPAAVPCLLSQDVLFCHYLIFLKFFKVIVSEIKWILIILL